MNPLVPLHGLARWFVAVGPNWWEAIFTLIGAIATFCAVVTAFVLQNRQSTREKRTKRDEELKLEVAAIKICEASLTIYDSIFNPTEKPNFRSKSDTSKRLLVMKGIVDRYANAVIHDTGLVATLVTAQTLLAQSAEDILSVPFNSDRTEFSFFEEIGAHRIELSDGLRQMISQSWQRPAYPGDSD